MAFAPARLPLADVGSSPADGPRGASVSPPDGGDGQSDFRGHAITEQRPAITKDVVRLKCRSEFLAVAATGRRWVAPAFVLQVGPRAGSGDGLSETIGLGFTATKRLGNAVARNRAKRRLREATRSLLPDAAKAGFDYVVIARTEVLTCAFQTLLDDLERAFSRVLTVSPRLQSPGRSKRRTLQQDRSPSRP